MYSDPKRDAAALLFPAMSPIRFDEIARFLVVDRRARDLLATADDVLGYSVFDRCRDGEDDYAEHRQVAFLVTCLAMAAWGEEASDVQVQLCTGPSFGQKGAAVYSGALDVADAVWLTAQMARCEHEYFTHEHRDLVTHSFVRASPRLFDEIVGQLTAWLEPHDVSCYVDVDFYMLTLPERRLDWLQAALRADGAMPLYTMRPPMHVPAFAPLRDRIEQEVIDRVTFRPPRIPVVADQDGALLTDAASIRTLLLDGVVRPVRWPMVVDALRARGVGRLYVAGPDAVFGRVRRTGDAFETVHLLPRLAMRPRGGASLVAARSGASGYAS